MFNEATTYTAGSSLSVLIWSIYAGIILSVIYAMYEKQIVGAFIRKIIKNKAADTESAKTLSELGCKYKLAVFFSLGKSSPIRKVLSVVGELPSEENPETHEIRGTVWQRKYKLKEIEALRFFIDPKLETRAESMYGKNDTNPFLIFSAAVMFMIVAVAATKLIPSVISLIENFLAQFIQSAKQL